MTPRFTFCRFATAVASTGATHLWREQRPSVGGATKLSASFEAQLRGGGCLRQFTGSLEPVAIDAFLRRETKARH